jgi:hypothetical protein
MTFYGKVQYWSKTGNLLSAYLDEPEDGSEVYTGTEQHSDTPVRVVWSDLANEWIEI